MKILIDPMLAVLAQDLPTEDKAELLMCILEYPNRDCDLGLWKYMKKQIDIDAQKYLEKCERIAANRQKKSDLKSTVKSTMESDLFSSVSKEEDKENIYKEKGNSNVSVSSNAAGIVENRVDNFFISPNFSIDEICRKIPKFSAYLETYLPAVVERAQKTLIKKRQGQWLKLAEILDWIQQESVFYKQNHGAYNEPIKHYLDTGNRAGLAGNCRKGRARFAAGRTTHSRPAFDGRSGLAEYALG